MQQIGQADLLTSAGIEDHEALNRLQLMRDRLQQRNQRSVYKNHVVLGMVDDVNELLLWQSNIQGVADGAGQRHTEVKFQMFEAVPGESADTISRLDAQSFQRIAQSFDSQVKLAVAVFVHGSIGQFGFDRLVGVHASGMLKDVIQC